MSKEQRLRGGLRWGERNKNQVFFFGRVVRAQTEPRWRTTSWISLIWTGMGMTAMWMGTGTATRLTTGVSWGTWSRPGHGCRYGTRITTFMARLPIIHCMGMGMGMRRLPSATVPPGYRQGMNQRGENIVQVYEWMNEWMRRSWFPQNSGLTILRHYCRLYLIKFNKDGHKNTNIQYVYA